MRWWSKLGLLAVFAFFAPSVGHAQVYVACQIEGTAKSCEAYCNGNCTAPSHATCDSNNDGWCVICGAFSPAANDSITGTTGKDWICTNGGDDYVASAGEDDVIDTGDGNDTVVTLLGEERVYLGAGNDYLYDVSGSALVYGGAGNDALHTSPSDDIVFGEAGSDTIAGGGGADQLYGGPDGDTINSTFWWTSATCPSTDDYLGSRICGDGGNDTISICGFDHQCISGGDGSDTCSYDNAGDGTDPHDVATVDCETATGDPEDARAAGMLCCDP